MQLFPTLEVEAVRAVIELLVRAVGPVDAAIAVHVPDRRHFDAVLDDYNARVRLAEIGNAALEMRSIDDQRSLVITLADDSIRFLRDRQEERIRQAKVSFNWTIRLFVAGGALLLLGITCAFLGLVSTAVVSACGGVVLHVIAVVMLKIYREANNRLDKIKVNLPRIQIIREATAKLGALAPEEAREGISGTLKALLLP